MYRFLLNCRVLIVFWEVAICWWSVDSILLPIGFDAAFSLKWFRLDSVASLSFQGGCGSGVAQFGLFEVAVA